TFSTAKTEKGACSKHGGVKTWFGPANDAGKTAGVKGGATTDKGTPKGAGGSSATGKAAGATAATASGGAGTPPAGPTGQCADGTYTRAKTQTGACSKHGGVKTWFAAATPAAAAAGTVAAPKNTPPPPPSPTTEKSTPPATGKAPSSTGKAQVVAKPADAPADATAKCKDGTYSTSKTHTGACSHHGGVAEWFK